MLKKTMVFSLNANEHKVKTLDEACLRKMFSFRLF